MARYALSNNPIRAGHIGSLACPTPGLKLPPKGPRPNPSPPGVVTWAFLSNPHPIPHSLNMFCNCRVPKSCVESNIL
ncbi:hypothetical protein Hanom_Chr00s113835g01808741 [Helianthus anomalus]